MYSSRRRTRSISLEMLSGIVVLLLILAFLLGFFLGTRHGRQQALKALEAQGVQAEAEAEAAPGRVSGGASGSSEAAVAVIRESTSAAEASSIAAKTSSTSTETSAVAAGTSAAAETASLAAEASVTAATSAAAETSAARTSAAADTTNAAADVTPAAPAAAQTPVTAEPAVSAGATETAVSPAETSAAPASAEAGPGVQSSIPAPAKETGEDPISYTVANTVIKASPLSGISPGRVLTSSEVDAARPEEYTQILGIREGDYTFNRISGKTWQQGAAVPLEDLRYVKLLHYNENGGIQVGELIVNKEIQQDITEIFEELFRQKYPVSSMRLIEQFWDGSAASSEAASNDRNNTAAFSPAGASGQSSGYSVKLNPRSSGSLSEADPAVQLFASHGFALKQSGSGAVFEKIR